MPPRVRFPPATCLLLLQRCGMAMLERRQRQTDAGSCMQCWLSGSLCSWEQYKSCLYGMLCPMRPLSPPHWWAAGARSVLPAWFMFMGCPEETWRDYRWPLFARLKTLCYCSRAAGTALGDL